MELLEERYCPLATLSLEFVTRGSVTIDVEDDLELLWSNQDFDFIQKGWYKSGLFKRYKNGESVIWRIIFFYWKHFYKFESTFCGYSPWSLLHIGLSTQAVNLVVCVSASIVCQSVAGVGLSSSIFSLVCGFHALVACRCAAQDSVPS